MQNVIQDIYGQVTNFFHTSDTTPATARRSFFVPRKSLRNNSLSESSSKTVDGKRSRQGSRMFNNLFHRNRVSSIEEDPNENVTITGYALPSITITPSNEDDKKEESIHYLTID